MKSKQFFSRILIGTLLIFSFFSCQKEEQSIFNQNSIAELTEDFVGQAQTRTQLRLAFGKTVANALVHPEFRKYIKKTSETEEFKGFNEIVFALHQDDQVTEELNLRGVLNAAIDDEVKESFGEDFLNIVLEQDPLVTIKLPDIFFSFNWDEETVIPMVAVKTPTFLSKPEDDFVYYQYYHHSGYGELVPPWKDLKYFCLVIKYSEDYLLWDDFLLENEKGISLFEFLPQAESCWDEIKSRIIQSSIGIADFSNMKYLFKRDFFYYYQQLCEPGFVGLDACGEPCPRDCPDEEYATTYLEKFEFQPIFFNVATNHKTPIFKEGMHMAIPISNSSISNIYYRKPLTIIGFRKCEFFNLKSSFHLNLKKNYHSDLGELILPEITFDKFQFHENPIIVKEVNVHLFTGWPIDKADAVKFNFYILNYDDEVKQSLLEGGWHTNHSWGFYTGSTSIGACDPMEIDYQFGNTFSFSLKN